MMKPRACPDCGEEMDAGQVQMRADMGSESATVDLWFVSEEGEDWLVVPSFERKEAYRCVRCGATVVRRGQ